jgi:hypothetical protein
MSVTHSLPRCLKHKRPNHIKSIFFSPHFPSCSRLYPPFLTMPSTSFDKDLPRLLINLLMAMFGTMSTSCAKVIYGEYIWSPLDLAAKWDGPWGRCGAFFDGFCWVVAQIGTNLSASVISASNDLTNLFSKYINIRRGVILVTITRHNL